MNAIDKFVIDRNVGRFAAQLGVEHDPARRETLRKLLIAEVDRYGLLCERLDKAQEVILEAEARLTRLKRLIGSHGRPEHAAVHEAVIASHEAALAMFESYRRTLFDTLDRSEL